MRHEPYRRQTHGCRSRRRKPDMASTRRVRGQHRRYESAASPIACAGSACSDGGVTDPVPVSVNQTSACDTQHYAQAHQHARTSWRFAPDAILPGHRRAHWWVPARTPTEHQCPHSGKTVGGSGHARNHLMQTTTNSTISKTFKI